MTESESPPCHLLLHPRARPAELLRALLVGVGHRVKQFGNEDRELVEVHGVGAVRVRLAEVVLEGHGAVLVQQAELVRHHLEEGDEPRQVDLAALVPVRELEEPLRRGRLFPPQGRAVEELLRTARARRELLPRARDDVEIRLGRGIRLDSP